MYLHVFYRYNLYIAIIIYASSIFMYYNNITYAYYDDNIVFDLMIPRVRFVTGRYYFFFCVLFIGQ